MANRSRRRLSFVDFAHPQAWHKLLEYTEMTIALAKLINDFTSQWTKICFLASSQLHQLVADFRKKTDSQIRGKCQSGGMMYDLWESLLLESELESQSLKKMACVMEKQICEHLTCFITNKTFQLKVNKEHHQDLIDILEKSRDLVKQLQDDYTKLHNVQGVATDFDCAHNEYVIEYTAANNLYLKYQYHVLPELVQDMEQTQVQTIDTICQSIQLVASILQEYHEQRHSSFASFVVTCTTTNAHEELENYICSVDDSHDVSTIPHFNLQLESFASPTRRSSSRSHRISSPNSEQLIIYAAPIIQMQISSRSKQIMDRLKDIKKEKTLLLTILNPQGTKVPVKQHDEQQQSEKKILHQMNGFMKRKHQLRLIELEESVLLAQQDLLKSHCLSMSGVSDNDQDASKRPSQNIRGLWRDAFRALKSTTTSSSSGENEGRTSFVRKLSSRKKKHYEHEQEEDQTVIDPVYETLKIAAETRKKTIANYLQQRQQTLNKQTSLNSQGSSELEALPSPRSTRHPDSSSSSSQTTSTPAASSDNNARLSNY